ncbi:MAG: hypothetical protein KY441_09735 [Actinobacteria bacterium]|nr:hypothetical protein [Actinomycetota bacterium]
MEAVLARQRALEDQLRSATDEHRDLDGQRDAARDRLTEARTRLEGTEEQRAARERERAEALGAQARLAATELAVLAVGAVDRDRDMRQVTAGLTLARTVFDRLRDVDVGQRSQDAVTNRLHAAFTSLRSRLAADFDPHLDTSDGLSLCVARLGGQLVGAAELERALAEQVERRRTTLSEEERDVIERHLLTEVGTHLGERVHAAWSLIAKMNEQLAAHPLAPGCRCGCRGTLLPKRDRPPLRRSSCCAATSTSSPRPSGPSWPPSSPTGYGRAGTTPRAPTWSSD